MPTVLPRGTPSRGSCEGFHAIFFATSLWEPWPTFPSRRMGLVLTE